MNCRNCKYSQPTQSSQKYISCNILGSKTDGLVAAFFGQVIDGVELHPPDEKKEWCLWPINFAENWVTRCDHFEPCATEERKWHQ